MNSEARDTVQAIFAAHFCDWLRKEKPTNDEIDAALDADIQYQFAGHWADRIQRAGVMGEDQQPIYDELRKFADERIDLQNMFLPPLPVLIAFESFGLPKWREVLEVWENEV